MEAAQPYPLQWPTGVPRTAPEDRMESRFGRKAGGLSRALTVPQAVTRVEEQISRMDDVDLGTLVISSNMTGTSRKTPEDPGVAVYFQRFGRSLCFPCDRYRRVASNLAAVAKHLEALRGIERWGVGEAEQLFRGFAALPAPDWRGVLGLAGAVTREDVEHRFRSLAKTRHPDKGGGHEEWLRIEQARRAALTELRGA